MDTSDGHEATSLSTTLGNVVRTCLQHLTPSAPWKERDAFRQNLLAFIYKENPCLWKIKSKDYSVKVGKIITLITVNTECDFLAEKNKKAVSLS